MAHSKISYQGSKNETIFFEKVTPIFRLGLFDFWLPHRYFLYKQIGTDLRK